MELFEIYIAYISWGNDGKKRPVVIAELSEEIVSIYGITSKYETKSEVVKKRCFKINDWKQSGLNKQSYIDTNTIIDLIKC